MSDRLEVINIIDTLIHSITRRHIPDYPEAEEALKEIQSYIDSKIIDILEYLSEQAIEYGITDAERYAWQHKDEADQMMIPLKAVKEALNHRKER